MLIAKKNNNVIFIGEEFASLIAIHRKKAYVYEFKFEVDPTVAVKLNAYTVKVGIKNTPPNSATSQIFSGITKFTHLADSILLKSAKTKDAVRQVEDDFFAYDVIDITSKIDNTKAGNFLTARIGESVLDSVKVLQPRLAAELQDSKLQMPVLQKHLYQISYPSPVTNDLISEKSFEMISRGVDPSVAAYEQNNIVPAASSLAGTVFKQNLHSQVAATGANLIVDKLVSKQLFHENSSTLHNTDIVHTLATKTRTRIEFISQVPISITQLYGSHFYVVFKLIDKDGLVVSTVIKSVDHTKHLSVINTPTKPPTIKNIPTFTHGKNILQIKQEDEKSNAIRIYRKVINRQEQPFLDGNYVLAGEVKASKNDGFVRFEDRIGSLGKIIYRAIPVSYDGILGAEFSNVVVNVATPSFIQGVKKYFRKVYGTITYRTTNHSVILDVKNLPPDPVAFQVYRSDISISEINFSPIGEINQIINTNTSINVVDTDLKDGHIYQYTLKLFYKNGDFEFTTQPTEVEFRTVATSLATTNILNQQVVPLGDSIDVEFDIDSVVTPSILDHTRAGLEKQKLLSYYQKEILDNREDLQNLLVHGVKRTNLTTGLVEDFGNIPDRHFSDKKFGALNNVLPLVSGHEYRYTVSAYLRRPDTLIATATKTVDLPPELTKIDSLGNAVTSYTLSPAKWLHPITLTQGNIVSKTSLTTNHAKNEFAHGDLASITTTLVSLAEAQPHIVDVKATRIRENKVFVEWRLHGNVGKLDHFIVIVELNGMRSIIGKSHNLSNNNIFKYLHVIDNLHKNIGRCVYYVVPVFIDYSHGTEVKSNEVFI